MSILNSRHRLGAVPARLCLALLGAAALSSVALAQTTPPVLEAEEPFTKELPAQSDHWGFIRGGFDSGATRIWDGDSGKMIGMVSTSKWSDLGIAPDRSAIIVSESIWTKINRGTRQDLVAVYDPKTLNLITEIPIPGRLIIGSSKNNFILSNDGKTAFIYNLTPASSVNVVDLEKRRNAQSVELPGCASLMPNPGVGFSALCSDGTLATVALDGKTAKITRSAPFFNASDDPIFDTFVYDRTKNEATFITYTGLISQAKLGATPTISQPWSIQAAAGLRPGDTKPLDVNYLPGGRQLTALHSKTGTLFVLMHMGEYWTQKQPATELWVVDLASKSVKRRVPLKHEATNIEVTQDDKPLLFLNGDGSDTEVMDAMTFEHKHTLERAGGGPIATFGPR